MRINSKKGGQPNCTSKKKLISTIKILILLLVTSALNVFAIQANDILKNELKSDESIIQPQQITVTGTITDATTGDAMPGVNVLVRGTTIGTLSDLNGKYTLAVSDLKAVLSFSFIGYIPQEIAFAGQSVINVRLMQSIEALEEVVVIGYGTARRADLTGSVGSVNASSINEVKVTNASQVILGKIPGVQVKQFDGTPGKTAMITIRGTGSLSAGTDPLYVIDGFPVSNLDGINLNNIETIDILKDASSTAIYGSRGSNGVVIITTKRGQAGKTKFAFDTYYGLQKIERRPEYLDAKTQAQVSYWGGYNNTRDYGYPTEGISPLDWYVPVPQLALDYVENRTTPSEPEIWGTEMPETDWHDLVTRIAPVVNYQLSASGGSENIKFFLSGEYMDQDGIVKPASFNRYSFQANLDSKLTERLSLRLTVSPSFTRNAGQSGEGTGYNFGVLSNAVGIPAFIPPYKPNGEYFHLDGLVVAADFYNPIALAELVDDHTTSGLFQGNASIGYEISDGLKFNMMFGVDHSNSRRSYFIPQENSLQVPYTQLTEGTSFMYKWINEYTLNYNRSFGDHNISALAGFSAEKLKSETNEMYSRALPNNLISYMSAANNIITSATSGMNEWSLVSYIGRLNYDYAGKYLLTTSIRTDGSSRFGSENKYGVFPSAALAWRISEEEFLKDLSFLNNMKLRASYGQTGNNNIGNYAALATLSSTLYPLGGNPESGFYENTIPNPLLTWEKQNSFNTGVDLGFFKGRLNLVVDFYNTINKNLLLNVNIPSATGFPTALRNIGKVRNWGWEAQIGASNIKIGDFTWSSDFNITFPKNEVLALGPEGDPIISARHKTMIGEPIGMFYGLIKDGIFETAEELAEGPIYNPGAKNSSHVGDIKFKDLSGPNEVPDGIINSYDRTLIGSGHPKLFYGFRNNFSYKNFNLSIAFQGVSGNKIWSLMRIGNLRSSADRKLLKEYENFWISEEQPGDGEVPRAHFDGTGGIREMNTWFLESGTYLRVNNIQFSYTMPKNITNRMKLESATIYLNSGNPFLFSTTSGYNPDVTGGNPLRPGEDNNQYPLAKSLKIGLNLAF